MRIVEAGNYFPEHPGGIETVTRDLVMALRRRGHQVFWVAADVGPRKHRGGADDVAVPAWNILERRAGFPYPLPSPASAGRLRSVVAAADVVHIHDCIYPLNAMLYALAKQAQRPLVLTQHVAEVPYAGTVRPALQQSAYRSVVGPMLRRADAVTFVSETVRRRFAPTMRPGQCVDFIENGIDLSLFPERTAASRVQARAQLSLAPDATVLLYVGRFVAKKGLQHIRGAAASRPEWQWLLVGRQGDVDAAAWQLDNVQCRRPVERAGVAMLLAAADLLVLPSRGEGLPVVIQEALVSGLPVLTTAETAAGLGDAGHLVDAWDASRGSLVGAIAASLSRRRPDTAVAFARRRWDLEGVAARYERMLEDIAGARTGRARPGSRVICSRVFPGARRSHSSCRCLPRRRCGRAGIVPCRAPASRSSRSIRHR